FGFEYKYPAMFLQNKISKDEMIDNMIKENWRYAKRQMTWFKRDKNIIWINKSNNIFEIIKKFKI
ncbi:MAG: tRNA (adenosine(37)-N6)-dimethylallyltransferase MiaA, partial [Patescibacteria group bacterium]